MKKTMIRFLTLALVLVMAVSLLPMAAMARNEGLPYFVDSYIANSNTPYYDLFTGSQPIHQTYHGTIDETTVFKPAQQIKHNGVYYDLQSVTTLPYDVIFRFNNPDNTYDDLDITIDQANEWLKTHFPKGKSSLTIPPYPETNDNGEQDEWCKLYSEYVIAIYGGHQHAYSWWTWDNNNHWVKCHTCGENFLLMDWHHDYNEDDFCDICGRAIIYYNISVVEADGAKVTVSGDRDMTAPYRDMIDVSVEVADGYELKELQVWKVRVDGTKARIRVTEVTEGSAYRFQMKNFDCEIVPVVVKK